MIRWRSQDDSLFGGLCKDEGHGPRVFRRTHKRGSEIAGGYADALDRCLGYLRTTGALRLFRYSVELHILNISRKKWKGPNIF